MEANRKNHSQAQGSRDASQKNDASPSTPTTGANNTGTRRSGSGSHNHKNEAVEALRGPDAYKYIGVQVHIELTTGEHIKGELYCADLQRSPTIIISEFRPYGCDAAAEGNNERNGHPLYIVHAQSIARFEALGPLNSSIDDIPRISPEQLAEAKATIARFDEEVTPKKGQHEGQQRSNYNKKWYPRSSGQNSGQGSNADNNNNQGQGNRANAGYAASGNSEGGRRSAS
ncbi:small nuclear ribonucleoprotein, putative [Babesia ovata]|uniref:Small nuclear ribonucleoprotein, putative n=1 Tax=Babesia ovata TaxID=189622 RepID=A0A2H6KGF6_9APIC|nr:small nuclear ribonucleoprotein, putative [Babesia ovata]GBE62082.1 small nuclear ribonucleoprotein, putative [Babesia ovata]